MCGIDIAFVFTSRMFYFNGGFLIFQNEERTADWCDSPGNPCFDCRGIADVTIYEQCADRIMCPVLAEKLMALTFSLRNCFENSESTCRNKGLYTYFCLLLLSRQWPLLCWSCECVASLFWSKSVWSRGRSRNWRRGGRRVRLVGVYIMHSTVGGSGCMLPQENVLNLNLLRVLLRHQRPP